MKNFIDNFDAILADPSISSTAKLLGFYIVKNQDAITEGLLEVNDERLALSFGRGVREIQRSYNNLGLEVSEVNRQTRTRTIKIA